MAILALKGHSTRGKEVIEILEMLGGKNLNNLDGASNMYYLIGLIVPKILGTSKMELDKTHVQFQFTYFTLEEFLEKYPYKVGDTVACYAGLILEKEIHTITGMQWDSDRCGILYYLDSCDVIEVEDILYSVECKTEQSKQERVKDMDLKNYGTATIKYIQENGSRDMELIIPYNQEIVNIDGRYILRDKKPQYPKTYKECCDVLGIDTMDNDAKGYKHFLVIQFQELLIARDAYWKIAGEQMGLGKPWEPDWCDHGHNAKFKYTITTIGNNVIRETSNLRNYILAFPTEEMQDAFYDNFKYLIEQCKELL